MNTEVNNALHVLQEGGLILYPTDTIWGIGCDAENADAVSRIYRLKQRDDKKSLIILLAEAKDIFRYVANPDPDVVEIIKGFDRPTTIIYEQAIGLPDNLVNADGTIAIRVTGDPFCKTLIKRLKRPLVSTSANISGMPSPQSFAEVSEAVKTGVDYVVDHRRNEAPGGAPSQIVRLLKDGEIEYIRR